MDRPPEQTTHPGARTRRARRAFHVLAKPAGPTCNLSCSYCFYLDKKALYPGTRSFRMSEDVLERFTQQYIETQPADVREIQFAWQGGEPTLMGLRFFERVVELQKRYARPGLAIENALQTNATLLDDDWGRFLSQNGFLVGISIDGPAELHDAQRRDRRGRGSFGSVMRGLEVLKRNRVEFNTLTVLHRDNCNDPAGLYDFLVEIGSKHLQFIPIVEHTGLLRADEAQTARGPLGDGSGVEVSARSITPEQWGRCLNGIFDRWLEADGVGNIFVQLFETMLGLLMGVPGALCVHAEHCGRGLAIEHNGDVYSCDHFVSPEYELGNIADTNLGDMVEGTRQRRFGRDKRDALPGYCRRCDHLRLCGGACPKDRISHTPDGEPGLAYLCDGYRAFYDHVTPVLEKMATCLRLGHPANRYRDLQQLEARARHQPEGKRRARTVTRDTAKIGRNAPCPCGSGRKFKKCCGTATHS
jgi:uncharacterized protein